MAAPAYHLGSNKDIDLDGSRDQLDDDRERKPEVGEREPRKDEIEEIVLHVSSFHLGQAYQCLDMKEEHPEVSALSRRYMKTAAYRIGPCPLR